MYVYIIMHIALYKYIAWKAHIGSCNNDVCLQYVHYFQHKVCTLSISCTEYTLYQNGRHLDMLLFLLKLDLDASFTTKYSFEFSAQERGIKG